MNAKAILSSKGQLVIPKNLRKKMGLHSGSELILQLTNKNNLKISSITQNISSFFGAGKYKKNQHIMSIDDIDQAINEAIINNDRN